MILVDATADGSPPGTIQRLVPRFSSDFPPSLTAHDIGLRDLLDSFYLLGETPEVVLYAISIRFPQELGLGLSPEVAAAVPVVADRIHREIRGA
jgi:hydrogenase maturation protease